MSKSVSCLSKNESQTEKIGRLGAIGFGHSRPSSHL